MMINVKTSHLYNGKERTLNISKKCKFHKKKGKNAKVME
jgi:hypothetical protein